MISFDRRQNVLNQLRWAVLVFGMVFWKKTIIHFSHISNKKDEFEIRNVLKFSLLFLFHLRTTDPIWHEAHQRVGEPVWTYLFWKNTNSEKFKKKKRKECTTNFECGKEKVLAPFLWDCTRMQWSDEIVGGVCFHWVFSHSRFR